LLHKRKVIAALTAATTIGMIGLTPITAMASSHREAPLISQDPAADNTDLYAFVDAGKLNIIANYIGLEKPAGGPLFSNFADDVEYRINISNARTADDNIVYKFRFHTTIHQPLPIPLPIYNGGPITAPNGGNQVFQQTYSVERDDLTGQHIIANNVPVAPANPGPRSFPSGDNPTQQTEQAAYEAVSAPAIVTLPDGGKVFAGPRKDAFFADLGSIFDLVALRPIQSAHEINQPPSTSLTGGVDGLIGLNVHEIALQLPFASVLAPGKGGTTPADGSIVGIYASSARQRVKVLDIAGGAPRDAGRWIQVSRVGLPLVNEVLIPLQDKDRWNGTEPADDGPAGFLGDILDSGLVRALPVLYPGVTVPAGGGTSRTDLMALATGELIGAPMPGPDSLAPADLLRINLATPPVAGNPGNRLGALQGDAGGFPNGRRLTDDVVDIELCVLAGALLPAFNHFPNNALTDGVDSSADRNTRNTFPYLGPPIPGYFQP
jgi:hypothetical protein